MADDFDQLDGDLDEHDWPWAVLTRESATPDLAAILAMIDGIERHAVALAQAEEANEPTLLPSLTLLAAVSGSLCSTLAIIGRYVKAQIDRQEAFEQLALRVESIEARLP